MPCFNSANFRFIRIRYVSQRQVTNHGS